MAYNWTRPSLLPVFLPWMSLLLLLLVKANRRAEAWWVGVPLLLICTLPAALDSLSAARNFIQAFGPLLQNMAFGTAAVWLLAHILSRTNRFLTFLATLPVWILFGGLAFAMGFAERSAMESIYMGMSLAVMTLILVVGFTLAGLLCRRQYRPVRVAVLTFLMPAVIYFLAGLICYLIISKLSGGVAPAGEFFGGMLVLALLSWLLLLPFLVLSFANAFYRERLISLLHLRPVAPAPPPILAPALEQAATP